MNAWNPFSNRGGTPSRAFSWSRIDSSCVCTVASSLPGPNRCPCLLFTQSTIRAYSGERDSCAGPLKRVPINPRSGGRAAGGPAPCVRSIATGHPHCSQNRESSGIFWPHSPQNMVSCTGRQPSSYLHPVVQGFSCTVFAVIRRGGCRGPKRLAEHGGAPSSCPQTFRISL